MERISRHVGTLLQNPEEQILATTVEEETALTLEWRSVPEDEIKKRVSGALTALRLENLARRSVFTLSSGEKQKCALASVVAADAEIVVMDEPTANLSPEATEELAGICLELKKRGVSLVIVDHRLYWLRGVLDKAIVLKDGEPVFHAESKGGEDVLDTLSKHPDHEGWGLRKTDVKRPDLPKAGRAACPQAAAQSSLRRVGDNAPYQGLEIKNLSFRYNRKVPPVYEDFNAAFQAGAVTAVTGANGAGKTTLSRLVAGLLKPSSGTFLFAGEALGARERRKRVAFVMQQMDVQLYMRTVEEELLYSAPRGTPKKERASAARKWMDVFGLSHLACRHPHSLSGGEKQRLVVACALMKTPEVMILDEPTSGLDGRNMRLIAAELKAYAATGGTVVLVTHDLEFLTIPAGSVSAFVGPSGGGKSTIAALIPRFYDPSEGTVRLDGRDTSLIPKKALRSSIGMVAQRPFLFDGTIRENLLLGDPFADDEKLQDALERANLGEFVRSLPGGIDTPVGERGVRISGGQAQRIAIARVFLKNPPVLILDEATSALDTFAEAAVQEALKRLSSGRTTIVIAHRLTTIRHATQICYLEDGKIVESGTHDELLAQDGRYRALLKTSERSG